ncbi:MAG TPA: nucleotidyltransferase family protein [Thermoanaerobaculia bacterium]|nr:nucleotidyltransferase family protein [Thermoanaerobaculia bacterium]
MSGTSTLENVRENLRRQFPDLAERFHVRSLGIFGSVVRGEDRPESDLDLLVSFDTTPTLLTFLALERTLSDSLGRKVDLAMRDALKPQVGQRVLAEVVPI